MIPTKNEADELPTLLRSIRRQTTQPREIIVADANSTDGTREIARQFGARVVEGGLTIVVSPLIALMKDQVDELRRKKVAADFVNSSMSPEEQRCAMDRCRLGQTRLLYVAPERVQSQSFLSMIDAVKIGRLAVDEAHCISQWGHDFRPDYMRLERFRKRMGSPPVTALTATATRKVQQDIVDSLGLTAERVERHVHGFDRPNLAISIEQASSKEVKLDYLIDLVRREKGPGIVYTGTRKSAEEVGSAISSIERRTVVYHAGLAPEARTSAQEAFLSSKARIAVATVRATLPELESIREVVFCCFSAGDTAVYRRLVDAA